MTGIGSADTLHVMCRILISFIALFLTFTARSVPPQPDAKKHVVIITAEREYKTDESLQAFTRSHLGSYRVTHLRAAPDNKHFFPRLEALNDADALLLSVRRRLLSSTQLALIRNYIDSGKPLIAIRTASHPFCNYDRKPPTPPAAHWPDFDTAVLGALYQGHVKNGGDKGPDTIITASPSQRSHPILKGIYITRQPSASSLYRHRDLRKDTTVLLSGSVGSDTEPVAWTFTTPGGGRGFYTMLGHPKDFASSDFHTLLTRALAWGLGGKTTKP